MKYIEKVHLRPYADTKVGFTISQYLAKNPKPSTKAMQNHFIFNFTKLQIMVYNMQENVDLRP
jgi:hypothetical protein